MTGILSGNMENIDASSPLAFEAICVICYDHDAGMMKTGVAQPVMTELENARGAFQ